MLLAKISAHFSHSGWTPNHNGGKTDSFILSVEKRNKTRLTHEKGRPGNRPEEALRKKSDNLILNHFTRNEGSTSRTEFRCLNQTSKRFSDRQTRISVHLNECSANWRSKTEYFTLNGWKLIHNTFLIKRTVANKYWAIIIKK